MYRSLAAYVVCAFSFVVPAWALTVFQVQAIGPAGYGSSATAISATGAVVGNYQLSDGTYRAFLWQGGQVTTLSLPAGATQTWATAIGGSGQAGGYTDSLMAPKGLIWDNFGNPVATAGAYIMGLNANGEAAGMAIGGDGNGYAFVTRNGVLTSLGQPGGGAWSSANAVNGDGAAAGTAMTAAGALNAFSASSIGATSLLGGLGGESSYATAISDSGLVAGHAQTASGSLNAVVWNGTTALSLGTLGGVNSYAYAVNAAGRVAGISDLAGGAGTAAFLYDNGLLYDLNALLAPGSGWQLLGAYGMNNSGQIVGRGLHNGVEQAFLLTPSQPSPLAVSPALSNDAPDTNVPEPSAIWLVGPAVLALIALRLRSR
ncbi:MAG: hypothetical protein HYX27_07965 [Acidobacteria bacterium]|nr:hypothetical protein [Acidobacteriota bacterium]